MKYYAIKHLDGSEEFVYTNDLNTINYDPTCEVHELNRQKELDEVYDWSTRKLKTNKDLKEKWMDDEYKATSGDIRIIHHRKALEARMFLQGLPAPLLQAEASILNKNINELVSQIIAKDEESIAFEVNRILKKKELRDK